VPAVQETAWISGSRNDATGSATLDVEHLARQTFGDVELERDILALFREQCSKLVPIISGNCQLPSRVDAAHTLKGGARAVGAVAVARIAEELETALRRHGELASGQGEALFECVAQTRRAIDERLALDASTH
jgi:HPt (histidine-containing phosphotransfer) domain-containing protein